MPNRPGSRGIAVWDIVRVDFPFADQPRTRRRPGLVVAVPAVQDDFAILWVLMITSARAPWPHGVAISDLGRGGLDHPCVVRTSKIAVLDTRLTIRIGELSRPDRVKVRTGLRAALRDALAA
jgi:mRNA-degrading endonuclease toxin of MazEF toxin-antitoxin module